MNYLKQKVLFIRRCFKSFLKSFRGVSQFEYATFAGGSRRFAAFNARKFFSSNSSKIVRNAIMLGVLSCYYHRQIISCIEDEVLAKARRAIDVHIYSMKKEFGT